MTANEIREWEVLREYEDGELLLAQSIRRAAPDPVGAVLETLAA